MDTLLAQRVKTAVKRVGPAKFLSMSGLSRSTLYEIIRGESAGSGRTLARLAAAGVDLDGIFGSKRKRKAA